MPSGRSGEDTVSSHTGSATASTQALVNLDVGHLRSIHDYMRQTLKVPPFRNGQYIGILATRSARGARLM